MEIFQNNLILDDQEFKNCLFSYDRPSDKDSKFELIPSYFHEISDHNGEFIEVLKKTKLFFWTSFRQYQIYIEQFSFLKENKDIVHCCGFGKTLNQFINNGIDVTAFISIKEFIDFSTSLKNEESH